MKFFAALGIMIAIVVSTMVFISFLQFMASLFGLYFLIPVLIGCVLTVFVAVYKALP